MVKPKNIWPQWGKQRPKTTILSTTVLFGRDLTVGEILGKMYEARRRQRREIKVFLSIRFIQIVIVNSNMNYLNYLIFPNKRYCWSLKYRAGIINHFRYFLCSLTRARSLKHYVVERADFQILSNAWFWNIDWIRWRHVAIHL